VKEIVRLLRAEVERAGGQSAWARRERINRTQLNQVLSGRRDVSLNILKALKIRTIYVRDDNSTDARDGDARIGGEPGN
jgi:hypothetical protein